MDENYAHEGQQTPTDVARPGFNTSFTTGTVTITPHSTAILNMLLSELFGADILQGSVMAVTRPSVLFCKAWLALFPLPALPSPSPRDCSTPHLLSLARLTRDSRDPSDPFQGDLMVSLQDTLHCRRDNIFLQYEQSKI